VVSACDAEGKVAATLSNGLEGARRARDAGFRLVSLACEGVSLRLDLLPRTEQALAVLRQEDGAPSAGGDGE
jgi:hypothetical protein